MEFIILSSLLIKIRAEELNFFNRISKNSHNKTEVYLKNFFSWHEPTQNPIYLSSDRITFSNYNYNNLLIDTTTSINLVLNLVNNLSTLTNSSDLNVANLSTILSTNYNSSSSNFLQNLTTSNQSSNLLNLENLTDLTSFLNSNLSSNSSDAENLKELANSSTGSSVSTLYDVPLHLILLLAFAYGMVSLTAVVGNSIVLWFVVRSRKLRTVTNIFIANLSIADILIGALSIPFQFQVS